MSLQASPGAVAAGTDGFVARLVADPYPPYQFENGGTIEGVDHDLIVAAMSAGGMASTVRLLPWDACLEALEDATADAVFQVTRTPERGAELCFSEPFRTARTLVFKRSETPIELDGLPALESVAEADPIGVVAGFSYGPLVDGLPPRARVERDSQEGLIAALVDGRLNLALADSGVAAHVIDQMDATGIEPIPGVSIARELHLAARRERQDVIEAFNAGLGRLRESDGDGGA